MATRIAASQDCHPGRSEEPMWMRHPRTAKKVHGAFVPQRRRTQDDKPERCSEFISENAPSRGSRISALPHSRRESPSFSSSLCAQSASVLRRQSAAAPAFPLEL